MKDLFDLGTNNKDGGGGGGVSVFHKMFYDHVPAPCEYSAPRRGPWHHHTSTK